MGDTAVRHALREPPEVGKLTQSGSGVRLNAQRTRGSCHRAAERGFYVKYAIPASGTFTIYINKAPTSSTTVKVAHFVLN